MVTFECMIELLIYTFLPILHFGPIVEHSTVLLWSMVASAPTTEPLERWDEIAIEHVASEYELSILY